ncbi:hypothetical protein [Metasolibacillus meyeri]|uniref:hypothetical protein n=1 Tax=Metasolibacillus meyeri TaxID=1071052 RepID=UPI0012903572|nr:hypothetical protein [Metasolibacillus meyeri]
MLKKIIHNEQGLSLIEVVASIIILTIILLSFFTFFISTAKTTKTSSTIFDATYYAQQEMEAFYNLTKTPLSLSEDLSTRELAISYSLEELGYEADTEQLRTFLKFGNDDINFDYLLIYSDQVKGGSLTQFTILICEKGKSCNGSAVKAQMTNIYEWRAKFETTN